LKYSSIHPTWINRGYSGELISNLIYFVTRDCQRRVELSQPQNLWFVARPYQIQFSLEKYWTYTRSLRRSTLSISTYWASWHIFALDLKWFVAYNLYAISAKFLMIFLNCVLQQRRWRVMSELFYQMGKHETWNLNTWNQHNPVHLPQINYFSFHFYSFKLFHVSLYWSLNWQLKCLHNLRGFKPN